MPQGPLGRRLGPEMSALDGLLAALFVLAVVAVLNYGVLVAAASGETSVASLQRLGGTVVVVAGLAILGLVYLARFQRRLVRTRGQLIVFGGCCLATVALVKVFLVLDARVAADWRSLVYLTPLSAFSILFGVIYGQREAIAASIMLAVLVGLTIETRELSAADSTAARPAATAAAPLPHGEALPVVIVLLSGALVAVLASRKIRKRLKLLHVGLVVGFVHAGLLVGFYLLRGRLLLDGAPPMELLWGVANGFAVGVVTTVSLPVIELIFGVATEIRLLELSDQDQSLLRHLMSLAPSTDNHSRRVALLAEAAADAIGANSLLALVASYYHDVGKMTKPEYFIENQTGAASPHDRLLPSLSALIIAGHVKDGVELAREAKLPGTIVDVIAQHHGTSAIEFFYNRYLEEAGDKPTLDATFFRYPGPRPATAEAAIVMLADAVEAASRTLAEPVPSRIETLIKKITTAKLLDGQLEDCRLTLSELRAIEQSFFRVLCAMYHARIDYPAAPPGRAHRTRAATQTAPST